MRARFDNSPWIFQDTDIQGWYDGALTSLRGWQARWVAYMVVDWMVPGAGSSCGLKFDPWNSLRGATQRAPIIGLYHELCHAYYYMSGRTVFDDFTNDTELLAIGIAPFDKMPLTGAARLSENDFRADRHQAARDYI